MHTRDRHLAERARRRRADDGRSTPSMQDVSITLADLAALGDTDSVVAAELDAAAIAFTRARLLTRALAEGELIYQAAGDRIERAMEAAIAVLRQIAERRQSGERVLAYCYTVGDLAQALDEASPDLRREYEEAHAECERLRPQPRYADGKFYILDESTPEQCAAQERVARVSVEMDRRATVIAARRAEHESRAAK
jgi:hypothetical protein